MAFVKGAPRPPNAGRKKGSKNKKTLLKVSDYLLQNNINIAQEIWASIQLINDPVDKTKLLLDLLRFVEAPKKEETTDDTKQSIIINYVKAE